MGATIFGFLTESFFFDRALIADKFRTIDEKRLRAELRAYRDFCLSSKAEIESEVSANKSSLKVLSGVECPDVRLLKQSAFYIEQYILPDPLFAMTHESGQMNDAISSYLGMGQSVIDRDRLATILSYLHSPHLNGQFEGRCGGAIGPWTQRPIGPAGRPIPSALSRWLPIAFDTC